MRHRKYKTQKKGKHIAALLLAAVLVTCFAYPYFYSIFLKTNLNPDKLIRVSDFADSNSPDGEFAVFSGKLVSLQGKILKLQSGSGDLLWQKELEVQRPMLTALDSVIVVADSQRGTITALDGQGNILWQNTVKGKLCRLGADEEFIWSMSNHQEFTVVEVFNDKGEDIAYLQVGDGEVLSVSPSAEGSHIVLSTAEVKDNRVTGGILLYNKEGTIVWAKSYSDKLVMGAKLTNDGFILALTEEQLLCLNMDGDTKWQRDIKGYISKVLFTAEGIMAVTLREGVSGIPRTDQQQTLLYDQNGKRLGTLGHDRDIIGLVEGKDHIGIYSARRICLLDYSGKVVMDREMDMDLMEVQLLEGNHMAYLSAGKLYFEPYL